MRWVFLVLGLLPLAGCLDSGLDASTECPERNAFAIVDAVEGDDLRVHDLQGQPAVLHVTDSEWYQLVGGTECHEAYASGVHPGSEIEYHAEACAESYPIQCWPESIILR